MTVLNLDKYCGGDPRRPYLDNPFSFGGYTFSTNGHIIVRVARRDEAPKGAKPMTEAAAEYALCIDRACEFRPMSAYQFPQPDEAGCAACDGRGTGHDCPDCECVCPDCDGSGKSGQRRSVSIDGALFDAKYIQWLLELPAVEIETVIDGTRPLKFRFDGGIGALFGLRAPRSVHLGDICDLPVAE